ncbi:MAG TPA: anthrone oxygenase family protein [Vicinamibacterales bacterium]|nr:anthrone oxygenase family protein [Vicinamibacterales bacterium]
MISTMMLLAALGSGLIAGLFFAFSVSVMRALSRIPAPAGIAAMQAINVVILNPVFGLVFFGTAVASLFLGGVALLRWSEPGSVYLLAGALFYVIGSFVVTLVFNVPRNNALARMDAAAGDAGGGWSRYVAEWTAWNHVRLIASLVASAAFTIAFSLF